MRNTTQKLCCLGAVLLIGTCFTLAQGQSATSARVDDAAIQNLPAAQFSTANLKVAAPLAEPTPPPPNGRQGGEDCSTATVIGALPYSDTGTTAGYADDYDPPDATTDCPYNPSAAADVVYLYTPPSSTTITIDLCASGYDTKVFVYETTCTDPPLYCDDDGCPGSTYRSILEDVAVSGGRDYYIVIDGYGGDEGTYDLQVYDYIPPPGACCVDADCVATNLEVECVALGGYWYEGETCPEYVCTDWPDCPEGTLLSQEPFAPDQSWSFGLSEVDAYGGTNFLRYEYFPGGAGGVVGDVHWWGLWLYNDGSAWSTCTESNPIFEITFYTDNAGVPGAVACGPFSVSVPGVATGILYASTYEMYYFEVDPMPGPCVTFDWISIQGAGDTSCWFLWAGSPFGDGYSRIDEDGVGEADDVDLSICLTEYVPATGACCDELTGVCTDGVDGADCVGANLRFVANTFCVDLVPPCGERTGACCYEDGSCAIVTREQCLYAPADMNCDGIINFDDIDPFVTALVGAEGYYAEFPDCNYLNGDIDGNGIVNFDDIDPFVNLLVAGGPPFPQPGLWKGWDSTCASCPCVVPCPGEAITESEPCGDDTNGGCNMNTPAFEPIACDDIVCGTGWSDAGLRDTDWYELVLPDPMVVTWTVEAEFPVLVGILGPPCGDDLVVYSLVSDAACTPTVASATVSGTVWLFAAPSDFYLGNVCGEFPYARDYVGVVTCEEPPEGACCTAASVCEMLTDAECDAAGGIYMGGGTTCDPNPCPTTGCIHTINLLDLYGDGWNGASVGVYVNAVEVTGSPFTIDGGSAASYRFFADTGDAITTTWTAGDYDSECLYEIFDGLGNYICGELPSPVGGLACTGNCDPCVLECPTGATIESEACGDDTNGGCNMNTPEFEPIACEETVCGTIWADAGIRDTDWYQIVTVSTMQLTWTVEAEFPVVFGFVSMDTPGSGDCDDVLGISPYGQEPPCVQGSVTTCLPAGAHWLFVSHTMLYTQDFALPCGDGNDYIATLTCDSCPVGACCVGTVCSVTTAVDCDAAGGTYLGDGTDCGPPNPCESGCTHTIILYDSYGDGWNGASVNVYVNSVEVSGSPFTFSNYSSASYSFLADDGDAITTAWNAGSYDEECSYEIYGADYYLCGEDPTPVGGLSCVGDCTLCPPDCTGAETESEACGDDTNGGCLMDTPAFEPISCGESVCGTIWADGGTRDTDWYEVVVAAETQITATLVTDFPAVLGFVEMGTAGSGDCADMTGYIDPYTGVLPCTPTSVSACLPAGVHWIFVSHVTFYNDPCADGREYKLTVECESPCPAALTANGHSVSQQTETGLPISAIHERVNNGEKVQLSPASTDAKR